MGTPAEDEAAALRARQMLYDTYVGPSAGETTLPAPGIPIPEGLPTDVSIEGVSGVSGTCTVYGSQQINKIPAAGGKKTYPRFLMVLPTHLVVFGFNAAKRACTGVKRAVHLSDIKEVHFCKLPAYHFLLNMKEGSKEISLMWEVQGQRRPWACVLAVGDARSRFCDDTLRVKEHRDVTSLRNSGVHDKDSVGFVPLSKRERSERTKKVDARASTTELGVQALKRTAQTAAKGASPVVAVPEVAKDLQLPVTIVINRSNPSEGVGIELVDLVLQKVQPNTPSQAAGAQICLGLSLTHCEGELVDSIKQLQTLMGGKTTFTLQFGLRNEVVLDIRPGESLGFEYSETPKGIVLKGVVPGSPAERCGVGKFVGCAFAAIDGAPVASLADLLRAKEGKERMILRFSDVLKERAPDDAGMLTSPRAASPQRQLPGDQQQQQQPWNANTSAAAAATTTASPTAAAPAAPWLQQDSAAGAAGAAAAPSLSGSGFGAQHPQTAAPPPLQAPTGSPQHIAPGTGAGLPAVREMTVTRSAADVELGLSYKERHVPHQTDKKYVFHLPAPGSPCERCGFGELPPNTYYVEKVDGVPVNGPELLELTEGKTQVTFTFRNVDSKPDEDAAASAPAPTAATAGAGADATIVRSDPREPLGLLLDRFRVCGVEEGSPAERCGFARHVGRRLVTVNGVRVRVIPEYLSAVEGCERIEYGFTDSPDAAPAPVPQAGPPGAPSYPPSDFESAASRAMVPLQVGGAAATGLVDQGYAVASDAGLDEELVEVNPEGSGGAYATVMHAVAQLVDRQSRTEDLLCTLLSSLQGSVNAPIDDSPPQLSQQPHHHHHHRSSGQPSHRHGGSKRSRRERKYLPIAGGPEPPAASPAAPPAPPSFGLPPPPSQQVPQPLSYYTPPPRQPSPTPAGGLHPSIVAAEPLDPYFGQAATGGYPRRDAYADMPVFSAQPAIDLRPAASSLSPRSPTGGSPSQMFHLPRGSPLPQAGSSYGSPQNGGPGSYSKIEIDLSAGKVLLM
eukprot:Rhum_TRINITY_DN14328_c19_g1::Rhum_TRINITY_DN14328_c19_g1_i1::g.83268::m.83268